MASIWAVLETEMADELSEWAEGQGAGFFHRPDAAAFPALAAVSAWATG
jgi:hypothetical protein